MATERIELPADLTTLTNAELQEIRVSLASSKQDIESQLRNYKINKQLPPNPKFKHQGLEWKRSVNWALRAIHNDLQKVNKELARRGKLREKRPSYMPDLAALCDAIVNNDHKRIRASAETLRNLLTDHYIE